MKLNKLLKMLDLSKYISNHIVGESHTITHRRIAGSILMVLGIGLVKLFSIINLPLIHFPAEVIGSSIHGIGLIPFVDNIEKSV